MSRIKRPRVALGAAILALSFLSFSTAQAAALFCGDMAGKLDELRKLLDKGYKGPKPEFEAGGAKKFLRKATDVPDDAELVYGRAIPEGNKGKAWWSYNENCGCWYRFEGKDTAQFSGMTTPRNSEFKPPAGAKIIKDGEVPADVAKRQELQGEINRLGRPPGPPPDANVGYTHRNPDAYTVVRHHVGILKPSDLAAMDETQLAERVYGTEPKSTRAESDAYIHQQGIRPTDQQNVFEVRGASGEKTIVGRPDNYGDAWWFQKNFRARNDTRYMYKVYLGIPPEQITNELAGVSKIAEEKGAVGLKFGASPNDVKRADRFVVYFDDPDQAVAFAGDMNKRLGKYQGETVPELTYRYGDRVGIGTDDMAGAGSSQRGRASHAAGVAAKACADVSAAQCRELTCQAFAAAGLSAKNFASASLAQSLGIPYETCGGL